MKSYNVRQFDEKDVVRWHKKDEFLKLTKVVDFLPAIQPRADDWVLKRWCLHFLRLGVPYAVCSYKDDHKHKFIKLWKEQVI